jgi:predicted PurR-regulated permease PerM
MRYIDIERQLTDIFTKPLDASRFAALRGKLVFAILMAWFEREFVFYLVYLYHFAFLLHFLYTHLNHFGSPGILACICLIMLIDVL